jgi:hypothetical protein
MPFFRKKPVVIEARQMPSTTAFDMRTRHTARYLNDIAEWCSGKRVFGGVTIATLEGDHLASPGDWIIKGVKGEFYPCKPDIFEMTYEVNF